MASLASLPLPDPRNYVQSRHRNFIIRHSTYVVRALTDLNCWQRFSSSVRVPIRDLSEKPCVQAFSWLLLLLLLWMMLYSSEGDNATPSGDLFRLTALIIAALLAGMVTDYFLRLPGLLGMLITGVIFRNTGFYYPAKGRYKDITITLKQIATTVGMIRAGVRLVPDAIYAALHCHHGLRLAGLAIVPSLFEAMAVAITSYFTLGYPAIWALCLGFLLCPNSPSVITPPMEELVLAGYGEEKNIGVLVCGAAGLDVAISVSAFDICISLLFQTKDLGTTQMIQKGATDIFIDLGGGFVFGLIAGLMPIKDDVLAVWKRVFAVIASGMIAIASSNPKVGLPGTGPLSCIVSSFVAAMLWKMQLPLHSKMRVVDIIQMSWIVLCPMLFAFTGSDVDISILDLYTIQWMVSIVLLSICIRLLGCCLVLCCGQLNWKEIIFVGLIFQGKATNQAALAPQILYNAWYSEDPENINMAVESVTLAVLAIMICTPLAHLGAKLGGPCLLSKIPVIQDTEVISIPFSITSQLPVTELPNIHN
uniref:Cation/H+ exchanger domain-containing protein n=2 Tax=Cuerna arida TaxID=1464854 RepID=A0A1B6GAT8_9HEMI